MKTATVTYTDGRTLPDRRLAYVRWFTAQLPGVTGGG
jgi:hypothetical protein